MVKGTVDTIAEGIVKKITRIDLDAGCKVKSQGIDVLTAIT